jgi:hypothetical protein
VKARLRVKPRFPEIVVDTRGPDGNAFALMGAVRRGMRESGHSEKQIEAFMQEAMAGDYRHLVDTVRRWVTVL